eukprot:6287979-Amphidinium_carterae.2
MDKLRRHDRQTSTLKKSLEPSWMLSFPTHAEIEGIGKFSVRHIFQQRCKTLLTQAHLKLLHVTETTWYEHQAREVIMLKCVRVSNIPATLEIIHPLSSTLFHREKKLGFRERISEFSCHSTPFSASSPARRR